MVLQSGAGQRSPLGKTNYSEPCAFFLKMFRPWVTQSLCRCYFLCINTNPKAYKVIGGRRRKESIRQKIRQGICCWGDEVHGHQGLPWVSSHWPNLVSFFSLYLREFVLVLKVSVVALTMSRIDDVSTLFLMLLLWVNTTWEEPLSVNNWPLSLHHRTCKTHVW